MKSYKYIFYIIIFTIFFFTPCKLIKADYEGIHYDIYNVDLREDAQGQYVYISGWAYIAKPEINHIDPSYSLELFDSVTQNPIIDPTTGKNKVIYETKGYDNKIESTSLTCIKWDRPAGKPACKSVLYAPPGTTVSGYKAGIEGVKKLMADTGGKLYDKVGFSFKIYLDEYECISNNYYIIKIVVNTNGIIKKSDFIQILGERITPYLRSNFVSNYSDGTVRMLASSGFAQKYPASSSDLLSPYFFNIHPSVCNQDEYPQCKFIHDGVFTVNGDPYRASSFDAGVVGQEYYYGIFYYATTVHIAGGLAQPGSITGKQSYQVYMPGAWVVAKTSNNRATQIKFPCPTAVDPTITDINLNCGANDAKANGNLAEKKKAFINNACYVTCSENINVTLPKRPGGIEASRGFAFDINFKTNRSCNITYTGGSDGEKAACDNWNVIPYTAVPSKQLNIEGSDYFGGLPITNGTIILEEVDRKVIQTDRLNGGYDVTYSLPQTYIESGSGKILFNNNENKKIINGGRLFYTNKFYEKNKIYNMDLEFLNLGAFNKWNVHYDCDYDTYKNALETPDDDDDDPKGYIYPDILFRPISLSKPFPGREPGSNWKNKTNLISTTKNGSPLYDDTNIIYEITLDKNSIQEIREYNKNLNYNYLDNSLDSNGKSIFIKNFGHIFNIK